MKTPYNYFCFLLILFFILSSCIKEKDFTYSEIALKQISGFESGYNEYCNLNLNTNFASNAVLCSFYGDYQNALDQATKRASITQDPRENIFYSSDSNADSELSLESLETLLQDPDTDEASKALAKQLLELLNTPSAKELFEDSRPMLAVDFIIEEANKHHFTLINEAHYNSQHRSFTADFLEPLWDTGYRYLALETLSHFDDKIYERGYPIQSSGYYSKDSNFGNLIRKALKIGYKLVPYETQNGNDGTLRDYDQAKNIYDQTWKQDKNGKVLIHAGYSHIAETGGPSYEPMGFQLKKLISQDIFTIDQVSMIGLLDSNKQHKYYLEACKIIDFSEPIIFLTKEDNVIVGPVNLSGIDVQVYHPKTKFENGRPDWMNKEETKQIPLNEELLKYKGNLIQAVKRGEALDAVPIDQFIISEGIVFLLVSGYYDLRLINCKGDMIATLELEVK